MGSSCSTDNAAGATGQPPTARVITLAGVMKEYSSHVTASQVLSGDGLRRPCFLCSSDKLFCNDYISPVDPEGPLHPGQLYFVLPSEKLRYPLSRNDMAELVTRGSSALAAAWEKGSRKNKKKVVRIMPALEVDGGGQLSGGGLGQVERADDKVVVIRRFLPVRGKMKRSGSLRGRVAGGYRCSYRPRLGTIPEV